MRKPENFVYSELRNQTSSTPYWPMIRYHVKQDAITRNYFEMAKRLQKIPAWPKFAQSNFNFIIQIVTVVQNEQGCKPFHWWVFENFAACHFREQIFDYSSELQFFVALMWTDICRIFRKLAAWDTSPFGEMQSNKNDYPRHQNMRQKFHGHVKWADFSAGLLAWCSWFLMNMCAQIMSDGNAGMKHSIPYTTWITLWPKQRKSM